MKVGGGRELASVVLGSEWESNAFSLVHLTHSWVTRKWAMSDFFSTQGLSVTHCQNLFGRTSGSNLSLKLLKSFNINSTRDFKNTRKRNLGHFDAKHLPYWYIFMNWTLKLHSQLKCWSVGQVQEGILISQEEMSVLEKSSPYIHTNTRLSILP